jgi:hypothetical protein
LSPVRRATRVRGRPRPPERATRTASTSPTSWLVSAPGPGVGWVASLRPRPSQVVCSLVVSPPRDHPSACWRLAGIGPSPFTSPRGGGLVGPHHAGVDLGVPAQPASPVGLGAQGRLAAGPGWRRSASGRTARRPSPRPSALRQVPPRDPGAAPDHGAGEDLGVTAGGHPAWGSWSAAAAPAG